jgi:Cro/C1-type HTH DNA-binding domain
MPKLDSLQVKHRMAELGVTSQELADTTGIPWGSLRNALAGRDPLTLDRIYAIARVLVVRSEQRTVQSLVDDLIADELVDEDGVPDPPPDQTKPKPKPERRKERGGSGPKRDADQAGAA